MNKSNFNLNKNFDENLQTQTSTENITNKKSISNKHCQCDDLSIKTLNTNWQYLFFKAREYMNLLQFSDAIKHYQQCIHITSHLMQKSNNHKTVKNQFVILLLEHAYCMRKKDDSFNKAEFLNISFHLLNRHIKEDEVKKIIKPVMDVLFSDIEKCDYWVASLISLDHAPTVH